ncbi:NlpC/P60 family protein [Desulforhopalus singaporensis]|uniref:NlpC/P60 family protein n=1 Tax=Desulforhopalus singaporensis TaxID=91360 RepID=A0A1H0JYA5_9BACT|nr:NlpC/P60 family protein [Desulforhopalus singaporensis]SDO48676.1 NlpC/P60 family protein [Desulforhopalus singaporensis]
MESRVNVVWFRTATRWGAVLLLIVAQAGCLRYHQVGYVASGDQLLSTPKQSVGGDLKIRIDAYIGQWLGVPYRLGGTSSSGVDCSGFAMLTYRELFGKNLPRTVNEQARMGVRVKRESLRPGDLVFFKTGFFSRHVGIYYGEGSFVHASSSRGVVKSSIHDPYWQKRYWQAKRFEL